MPTLVFIAHDGTEYKVDAVAGQSAMQAAVNAGVPGILADCGGFCSCATCHGYIDPAWVGRLAAASKNEADMLSCAIDPRDNSRLTCQVIIAAEHDGLIVRLPASQL